MAYDSCNKGIEAINKSNNLAFTVNERTGRYLTKREVTPDDIISQAVSILHQRVHRSEVFTNPIDVSNFLITKLSGSEREIFAVLLLDNRHRLISYQELFFGTIDGCSVHPREIVRACLEKNAAAVIFCHNHPSGVAIPSSADKALTARLKDALTTVDIRVLDHIIVGGSETVSFAERGLL